jgi:hypothetical protein
MATATPERNQPILLQTAESVEQDAEPRIRRRSEGPGFGFWAISSAAGISAIWVGITGGYLVGMLRAAGFPVLPIEQIALYALIVLMPPLLLVSAAWALSRGIAMSKAALALADATDRLFSADETAARTAARLGRVVRRELDGLNAGLDGAFARLRALESVLEQQIAAVDEAGARMDVRGEAVAARLTQERERIEGVAGSLADAASRAGEIVAGRSAQLKATVEAAESALRGAGQSLEVQAANFRQAAQQAAEAPKNAAIEFDNQAKRIESVSDAAMARAEFVLGRHERHRAAMGDLLQRLKDESIAFESALGHQRASIEKAVTALGTEAEKFEALAGESDKRLDLIMSNASSRSLQLAQGYGREVERLRESADAANVSLAKLVDAMRDAGTHAQALIGETTGQAKTDAKALVGEAMAECERLLRAAGEMSIEAGAIRATLAKAVEDVERHIFALPSIAQQEAQRVRELVRSETEEILDFSARTLSTIHSRTTVRNNPVTAPATQTSAEAAEGDGLRGLARRLTQRPKRKTEGTDIRGPRDGKWDMSELLAAADTGEPVGRMLKSNSAAALGALEALLADLAIDLGAMVGDFGPADEEWRRYLAGDRSVFARRLADTIDSSTVDKIASHYRDNERFRDAANAYIAEFEALLARANEGDAGGLLASTLLSADTGKIYLAIAYALGRL